MNETSSSIGHRQDDRTTDGKHSSSAIVKWRRTSLVLFGSKPAASIDVMVGIIQRLQRRWHLRLGIVHINHNCAERNRKKTNGLSVLQQFLAVFASFALVSTLKLLPIPSLLQAGSCPYPFVMQSTSERE